MARPNRSAERREMLLPALAAAFVETGYRRATTAALAKRCGVQENTLYRLWPDKKRMFLAAIDHVFLRSASIWAGVLAESHDGPTRAERILTYEAAHHGEFGLYRILFTGLGEVDDPQIEAHLRKTYLRFHRLVRDLIAEHRDTAGQRKGLDPGLAAWALLGLGTVANIGREIGALTPAARRNLLREAGMRLLAGGS